MATYEKRWVKDPDATLDYTWDWTDWLNGDTISGTPTITVPAGITKSTQSNTTTAVTAWMTGGTVNGTYDIACKIVTAGGRTDERTVRIEVRNR